MESIEQNAAKAFQPERFWQNGAKAKIQKVIDGDTVVLDFEENIRTAHARLIGINTPEVKSPYTQEQCFGPQASARLKILVENEPEVYVLRGIEPLDRYDRLLVYLFRASDGKFINELMLEEGYAYFLSIPPNDAYRDVFKSAEASAKSQKRGLWTACEKFLK